MRKSILLFLVTFYSFSQTTNEFNMVKNVYQNQNTSPRTLGGNIPLSTISLGVGLGVNHLFKDVYDYSLTTDNSHLLKIENLEKNNIIVSPVLIFRFGKLAKPSGDTKLLKQVTAVNPSVTFIDRLSLLLSIDFIKLNSSNVGFNEKIDGGIGVGYTLASNLQIGLFLEQKTYRQMREYVTDTYINQPIPNGTSFYSDLDTKNNNLFYNKTLNGLSVKLIFNINTLKN